MPDLNRESRDARIARLKAMRETPDSDADYSWEDALPPAPAIPTEPGQTVALMIPRRNSAEVDEASDDEDE